MNILCISKYASPPKYGVAARLFYLAKEFVSKGHKVTLMTSNSTHLADFPKTHKVFVREDIDGVDTIWFNNRSYKKTASASRVLSWFDFEKSLFRFSKEELNVPDVVIVSSLSLLSIFYGWTLKRKFKAKLIFEVRDIWPLTLVEEGGVSKYHPFALFMAAVEKFGYRVADLIVGTMPRLDMHVRTVLGYDKRFYCSPLGFDKKVMVEREGAPAPELDEYFPKNKKIVGYAGSMGISNNLDGLVRTIKALKSNQDIHFVLVGAGDLRDGYETKLIGCKNVTFVPRIPPEKVPAFLQLCDVLYLATQDSPVWDYGQSMNKVVEYMYAGKPVIATYSGYPSMLNEAGSGVFVRSDDDLGLQVQIEKLCSLSKEELVKMGENGNKWITSKRPYDVLAKEYLKQIEALFAQDKVMVDETAV